MKKIFFAVLAVIFIGIDAGHAQEMATITGEVIDVSCYVMEGAKGADHATCALACIKGGEPAGILDEKSGVVYIVITADHTNPATKVLPFVAKMVEVTGKVSERSGVRTIDIQTIKEISAPSPAMTPEAPKAQEETKSSW